MKKNEGAACSGDIQCVSGNCSGNVCAPPFCSADIICGTQCSFGGLIYGTVTGSDSKCWFDRNLGATQVATAYNDSNAYGWYFQWGRGADGHQISTSGTTSIFSSSDNPGHSNFIISDNVNPYDWRSPPNDNLWQGVNGINNPCPTGFRLPTQAEWSALVAAAGITGQATAYSSTLKFPSAGIRNYLSAGIQDPGNLGAYWSSNTSSVSAVLLYFNLSGVSTSDTYVRTYGSSVRCIKN